MNYCQNKDLDLLGPTAQYQSLSYAIINFSFLRGGGIMHNAEAQIYFVLFLLGTVRWLKEMLC